nr:lysozyme g [Ciona intestinalis]AOT06084.1 g-type lysozyme 3 [Ciona intestinalis]|eukprot:XP_002120319.1 lysozyme g [Ciona intestinalis]
MAYEKDLRAMETYKEGIIQAARNNNLEPSLIAGIASRESNGGRALDKDGLGDHGNGFGIMQVDKRHHTPIGGPYSNEHINQGATILRNSINAVEKKFPTWSPDLQLRGGVAAYNFGVSNVRTPDGIDRGTTGNNYSADVIKRAEYFKQNGY